MQVVYSGSAQDGELLSKVLGEAHQIIPWDQAPSNVPCVVCFGAPISPEAWSLSRSVIVVIHDGIAWDPVPDQEVLGIVVRGPSEGAQLRSLAQCAERLESARRYAALTTSPFAHDLRGIASVVRLSAQVLAQKGLDSHGQRLNAAALRMSDLLEDLQIAGFARGEGEGPPECKSFGQVVGDLSGWFESNHRDRTLEIELDGFDPGAPSPACFPFLLRGVADGAVRMTGRSALVSLKVDREGDQISFESTAPCADPSPDVMDLLTEAPEEWGTSGLPGSLFRLVTARLLARAKGGQLTLQRGGVPALLRLHGRIPL